MSVAKRTSSESRPLALVVEKLRLIGYAGFWVVVITGIVLTRALVVLFKIPAATNAMAGAPWWDQSEGFIRVAGIFDKLFLICAAIVPIAKAGYLVATRGDRLAVVHLTSRIS